MCKEIGQHSHSSIPFKPKVDAALADLKLASVSSQLSSRSLIANICCNVEETIRPFLSKSATLARNIRGWRQKNTKAPAIPTSREGYQIPVEYKYHNNGDLFLLYDSGEDDSDRTLIFGSKITWTI